MAFEALSDKLTSIFKKIRGQARLTEANMDSMLKEVRMALLEADVNFKVVKAFTNAIKEKALGQKVLLKLNPGQQLVSIVRDELVELLGSGDSRVNYSTLHPTVIMLVGLQGTGKTTTAGKLANLSKYKLKKKTLLVALDVYRPAAIEQLKTLAKQIDVDLFEQGTSSPVDIAKNAYQKAINERYEVVIFDTAGRLHIDDSLMEELQNISTSVPLDEILLLMDAMSGQDAVNVANSFNERLKLTGLILSKLDGDARGGSALSIKYMTGLAIKFAGVGEKINDLDEFHPDRMADRILGMGDILTLVEKAQQELDEKETKKAVNKMMDGKFDLNDMLKQMKQIKKMGPLGGLLKLIPGMPKISEEQQLQAEKEMKLFEVIINSMTPEERHEPSLLKYSRKQRIASGSGKTLADINKVLKKFEQSQQMMKQLQSMKKSGRFPPGGGFPPMG